MYTIYLLILEQNKYYVGYTDNFLKRFEEHKNGNGSVWTSVYKPISFNIKSCSQERYIWGEAELFFETVMKYGIENVRGFNVNAFSIDYSKMKHTIDIFSSAYFNIISKEEIEKKFSWKNLPLDQKLVNVYNPIKLEKKYFFLCDLISLNKNLLLELGYLEEKIPKCDPVTDYKLMKNHFEEIWIFISNLHEETRILLKNCDYIKNYKGKFPNYSQLSEIFFVERI